MLSPNCNRAQDSEWDVRNNYSVSCSFLYELGSVLPVPASKFSFQRFLRGGGGGGGVGGGVGECKIADNT